jgi:hypothetical protein
MSFDIDQVLKDMAAAASKSAKQEVAGIREYADSILENEKESLKELGEARVNGEITAKVFDREIAREKKVVQTELLTIQLMTDAAAQRAANAAIDVFIKAVKAAI